MNDCHKQSPAALASLLSSSMTEDNRMDRLDAMCLRLLSTHAIAV
jgi:hypothetical protein